MKEKINIFEEGHGREVSLTKTSEAANNLVGFFDLLLKVNRKVKLKKRRAINA